METYRDMWRHIEKYGDIKSLMETYGNIWKKLAVNFLEEIGCGLHMHKNYVSILAEGDLQMLTSVLNLPMRKPIFAY